MPTSEWYRGQIATLKEAMRKRQHHTEQAIADGRVLRDRAQRLGDAEREAERKLLQIRSNGQTIARQMAELRASSDADVQAVRRLGEDVHDLERRLHEQLTLELAPRPPLPMRP